MVRKRRRLYACLLVASGGGGLLIFFLGYALSYCLELEVWDVKAKQLLLTLPVKKEESFSLQYTHSTAKTIIEEHFRIAGADCIVATRMIFESAGAGIPDVTPQGAQFRIGQDGRFMIDNINKQFISLDNIRVAYYYPYKLILRDQIYKLDSIARGRLVDIRVRSWFGNHFPIKH